MTGDKENRKNKGFCHVIFANADSLQKILEMNGTELDGRELHIEVAKRTPARIIPKNTSTSFKKPIKEVKLEHILKYITSKKGTILNVLDTIKYEGNTYQIDQNNGTIKCQNSSRIINGKYIFCCHKGVVCYDPFKLYDVSEKLMVTYELNLSPKSVSVEFEIPYVPGATKYLFQGTTVIFFVPYKVALDKDYFKSVIVYRLPFLKKNDYTYVFVKDYAREDFHITCACSTLDYLIVSRLPFSENELRIEMEKTKQYYEYLSLAKETEERLKQYENQMNEQSQLLKDTVQKTHRYPTIVR